MKLTNTFVQGKMNKDVDERLLDKGQYPHAENIRVANSDGSDVGAIENVKGNEGLTSFGLSNAKTIGVLTDGSNQKLYWFVTSDTKDLLMEYDLVNSQATVILEATNPDGLLNFHKDYLITGVVKIINGDSAKDMIIWTDDRNPPRKVNINRAKTYGVDGFIEDDISVIKKPPRYAPNTQLTYTESILENNIEDRFLSFCYRYKYLDGEWSATSTYTNYNFSPDLFDLDYQTMENEGMVNVFNAINISFDTGDKRVTDIQLILKESNSNALAIIETFNKGDEGWLDSTTQTFKFANSKKYAFLPEDELYRPYDNVPKLAKALEMVGNRVVFGNYTENYNMVNEFGERIVIDYDLSLLSNDLSGVEVPVLLGDADIINDTLTIDLTGILLNKNTRIELDLYLTEITYSDGDYSNSFSYILNDDFVDAAALAADLDFISFVDTIMTGHFLANYTIEVPPAGGAVDSTTGFVILSSTATSITFKTPTISWLINATPPVVVSNWAFLSTSNAGFREISVDSSIKTNRSYEAGIIYMDEYGRTSTVLTDSDNTIYVPQEFSINQNKLVINVNHQPPAWADRYKVVIKQNKAEYQTIYANVFYEDGLFRWVLLEGANKDKVKEGDVLIVKSDLGGVVEEIVKVRVLEVTSKDKDFLEDNENQDGDLIVEEQGLYMKIKSTGFDMNWDDTTARTFEGGQHERYPSRVYTAPLLGEYAVPNTDPLIPFVLNAGSTVRIYIKFQGRGAIEYQGEYDKTRRVNADYASIQEWFETEVGDLGSFGDDYTWDGLSDIGSNIDCGWGLAGTNNYISGYGFAKRGTCNAGAQSPESFYVVAHRDGTKTRSITTTVKLEVLFSEGTVIFETEPEDIDTNIFYETEQTFDIVGGYHEGNLQNQSAVNAQAIVELDFFNCYVMGNGAESYRYKDAFNKKYLNIDLRPTSTSIEEFKEVRRYADLTYSGAYNENTNLNGLNNFNLSTANYKEDIDKKYGFIQKLYSRDTDLVVFQEDKVSKVLYGKDVLTNADGSSNVASILDVLGQQIPYSGEYGISRNPESFSFDGNSVYWADAKRGSVCRLNLNGIVEISKLGMADFFRDQYEDSIDTKKLGAFDPTQDQYIIHNNTTPLDANYEIGCAEFVVRNGFGGTLIVEIDYGVFIGSAGFDYSSTNDIPVKYDLTYDGNTVSTGYVGDAAYNAQLNALGLPNVSGAGTGTLAFTKDKSIPRTATVTVTAPICGANFRIDGNCVTALPFTVISVILNDALDVGLTVKNRYKWSNATYSSIFTEFDSVFEADDDLDLYDLNAGNEGAPDIPLTDATITVQSFSGTTNTVEWLEGNQLGYLISDTLYTDAEFLDIVAAGTFPIPTITSGIGSDIREITFPLTRPTSEQYLYLVWDYRNDAPVINVDTKIRLYFDSSGSMNNTEDPLNIMRDTILKDRLLPLYNNDSALYDASVTVENIWDNGIERTIDALNILGETPEGNVIVLLFQDEAHSIYHPTTTSFDDSASTSQYDSDIVTFRNRLTAFPTNYYNAVVFQVDGFQGFKEFVLAVENGTGVYSGGGGLSDKTEINFKYDITDGGTPNYYLNQIVNALTELGYEL